MKRKSIFPTSATFYILLVAIVLISIIWISNERMSWFSSNQLDAIQIVIAAAGFIILAIQFHHWRKQSTMTPDLHLALCKPGQGGGVEKIQDDKIQISQPGGGEKDFRFDCLLINSSNVTAEFCELTIWFPKIRMASSICLVVGEPVHVSKINNTCGRLFKKKNFWFGHFGIMGQ